MRKYNIFVKFEIGEEFTKLYYSFDSIPEAIEYGSEFVKDVNKIRKAIGVNKELTEYSWYIVSDDEKFFINYEPEYRGYLVTDFDNMDNKTAYVY